MDQPGDQQPATLQSLQGDDIGALDREIKGLLDGDSPLLVLVLVLARPQASIGGSGEIMFRRLMEENPRMPDRLMVGEVRGAKTLDFVRRSPARYVGALSYHGRKCPRQYGQATRKRS